MHIHLSDHLRLYSEVERADVRDRVACELQRFGKLIREVVIHISPDESYLEPRVRCAIHVAMKQGDIAITHRIAASLNEALSLALDAIEPKVACRANWKSRINIDSIGHWFVDVSQPLRNLWPHKNSETQTKQRIGSH